MNHAKHRSHRHRWALCWAGIAACIAPAGHAALNLSSCSVSNATVAFGIYNPLNPSTLDNNAGRVDLSCQSSGAGSVPVTVQLSKGQGSFTARTMKSTSSVLLYNIYTSATYATVWGDGSGGTSTQSAVLTKAASAASWVVYGRIPAQQKTVQPGEYSDLLQVTVSW
ncbi:MAG: SCPU domain-containing protein [Gammaproteobacteria bacterium]|nr:SCPU domain-containing protein [Gammaproteobacteria bacterium]